MSYPKPLIEDEWDPDWVTHDLAPTHRMRRGKLVEIPEQWRGRTAHPQTIRKRYSKLPGKLRRQLKRRRPERGPSIEEWDD